MAVHEMNANLISEAMYYATSGQGKKSSVCEVVVTTYPPRERSRQIIVRGALEHDEAIWLSFTNIGLVAEEIQIFGRGRYFLLRAKISNLRAGHIGTLPHVTGNVQIQNLEIEKPWWQHQFEQLCSEMSYLATDEPIVYKS